MVCSTCGAETWSSTTGLRWEMVGRDLLGPSQPVDQRAAAAGTFWTRMRGAAVRSDVTPKTECYGVAGLCLQLNQCTKQRQTSPQLSGTPEPLGCLHATEPFTLGVLRTSCDRPNPRRGLPELLSPLRGHVASPALEDGAGCSPIHPRSSPWSEPSPGTCPGVSGEEQVGTVQPRGRDAAPHICSHPGLMPCHWVDAGGHTLSPWVAPFGCPCLAFLIFKIRVSRLDIICGALSFCPGI